MTSRGVKTEPVGSGADALRLLRSNRPFRSLWCARGISFLGDSLGLVTLLLYTANTTGQALAVALLLLVGDFAPALLGPFTGTVSDRFDLRRVMILSEHMQGVLVTIIALTLPSLPLLLALVALRAMAGQVFQPAPPGSGSGPGARPYGRELCPRVRHERLGGARSAGGRGALACH